MCEGGVAASPLWDTKPAPVSLFLILTLVDASDVALRVGNRHWIVPSWLVTMVGGGGGALGGT